MAKRPEPFVAFGPPDQFGIPTEITFEGVHAQPERQANRELFHTELEFVQGLANPFYLYYLARYGYMEDPAFLNYLNYLAYWKKPEYARFILCVRSAPLLNANSANASPKLGTHTAFTFWTSFRMRSSG